MFERRRRRAKAKVEFAEDEKEDIDLNRAGGVAGFISLSFLYGEVWKAG